MTEVVPASSISIDNLALNQMNYLTFDKTRLINLSYSLNRELIRSNRAGSFACTTIITSNTRKYHGLLVCPLEYLDGGHHVLLSGIHETIIQHNQEFNLGIHKYDGDHYNPRGHKYLLDFELDPTPRLTYRVGGVVLCRESLLAQNEERLMIRYTLLSANSPTLIRFRPYLAFRNIHSLSKANMDVITRSEKVSNGIKTRMYQAYPYLYLQFSRENDFISAPDWNYHIEYIHEEKRGYGYKEDLYTPGYFEMPLKKGEAAIFSAGTQEADPERMKFKYQSELKKRIPRNTFHNCLLNSAQQFFVTRENITTIMSGFPWQNSGTRHIFASLPGLTLAAGDTRAFRATLENGYDRLQQSINTAGIDEPLWFIWSLQQYTYFTGSGKQVWKVWGKKINEVLCMLREGMGNIVSMHDNGLLYCSDQKIPRTWMNCMIENVQVTPRYGYIAEVNALWYNSIKFALELAGEAGNKSFPKSWNDLPSRIAESFPAVFWDHERGYLADHVHNGSADWSVRPNQLLAASLRYSPLGEDIKKEILEVVSGELLTPKGLRTLSPKNPNYRGIYAGNQHERDLAAHQGTVYPWLLGHFAEARLRLYGKPAVDRISHLLYGFKEDMEVHGIGTISELYDGDPPHYPDGAVSYAWSVAELLRIDKLVSLYKNV